MSSWADNANSAYFNRKLERQHCQDLHLKGGKAENLMFGWMRRRRATFRPSFCGQPTTQEVSCLYQTRDQSIKQANDILPNQYPLLGQPGRYPCQLSGHIAATLCNFCIFPEHGRQIIIFDVIRLIYKNCPTHPGKDCSWLTPPLRLGAFSKSGLNDVSNVSRVSFSGKGFHVRNRRPSCRLSTFPQIGRHTQMEKQTYRYTNTQIH